MRAPEHRAGPLGLLITSFLLGTAGGALAAPRLPAGSHHGVPATATFSIVAADTADGEWGIAVASRFLAVGAVVPYAEAGAGALATQAIADPAYGPQAMKLLAEGRSADEVIRKLVDGDPDRDIRQIGIVDSRGETATFTGRRCEGWAGGVSGPGYVIQGNDLVSDDVVYTMARAFERTEGSLAERLLAALAAGDAAGGDRRGKQAAALLVVRAHGGYLGANDRYVDLRVDDAPDPVPELQRLYDLHARTFLPAVHTRLGDEALARGDRGRADREFARVIHLYRAAIAADPGDVDSRNGLAWFYARHRVNLDEALRLADEAHRLAPDSWQVLDTLAEIHYERGDLSDACRMAREALESDPRNPYLKDQAARFQAALDRESRK